MELILERSILHFQYLLIVPFLSPENETHENLLGSHALIGIFSTEFLCKVHGIGLQRADAVVVQYIQSSELVGSALGKRWSGGSMMCRKQSEDDYRTLPEYRTLQQLAECAFRTDEQPYQRKKQQGIAHISHRCAVSVALYRHIAALSVCVVA